MRRPQHGFALVAAIILVVLLAAMAAFVTAMVSGQSANQNLERLSRVAELSAQAGLEWGTYRVMRPAAAPACPPGSTILPGAPVTLPGSLASVQVNVMCTRTMPTEGAGTVSVYQITATATYGGAIGNPDFVQRQKTAVFTR